MEETVLEETAVEDTEHNKDNDLTPDTKKLTVTALAWLGRQEYSIAKFTKKLKDNHASDEQVQNIVEEFCARNWLSEQRYCEGFVRARIGKGQGKLRILNDGRGHQLDSNTLSEAIDAQEVDWFELALSTYVKRYGTGSQPKSMDIKEKAKRMRFMQYRGFTMEQVAYAMEEAMDEAGNEAE